MGTTWLFALRRLPDRPASRIAATPRYDIHLESGGDTLDEPGETVGYGGDGWPRRSRIATIPVGYGDGYPRGAADGTPIGTPYGTVPLAGKVSMDMITADVTDIPNIDFGTEVTLWGGTPSVDEVASHCGTIGYELCTRITGRTPDV